MSLWGMNVDQAIQRICATTANTPADHEVGAIHLKGSALSPAMPVTCPRGESPQKRLVRVRPLTSC